MKTYKPGDIATALRVSISSIRNWTDMTEFQEFFSELAKREGPHNNAKQREYTQEDLYVLNTIAKQKTRFNTWEDVAQYLREGNLDTDLPISAALIQPMTAAETFADAILLRQENKMLEKSLAEAQEEISFLRKRVDEIREEEQQRAQNEAKLLRAEHREQEQRLNDRIVELNRIITRLEINNEMLKGNKDETPKE